MHKWGAAGQALRPRPVRLWMRLWSEQWPEGEREQAPSSMWGRAAGILRSLAERHHLDDQELRDLIMWWWHYKTRELARRGAETPFAPDPRPLWGCVGEFRQWMTNFAPQIAERGVEAVCREPLITVPDR